VSLLCRGGDHCVRSGGRQARAAIAASP
jgi:hypothetical protein